MDQHHQNDTWTEYEVIKLELAQKFSLLKLNTETLQNNLIILICCHQKRGKFQILKKLEQIDLFAKLYWYTEQMKRISLVFEESNGKLITHSFNNLIYFLLVILEPLDWNKVEISILIVFYHKWSKILNKYF